MRHFVSTSGAPADRLLSPADTADFLGLTERQLQQMRRRGGGPPFVLVAHKTIRYSSAALRQWVESRTCANTSEAREREGVAR